ncbi:MAG: hypothetical protein U1E45_09645 [Geminicoccaceae bacterium]
MRPISPFPAFRSILVAVAIFVCSVIIALLLDDPHVVQRGGALIAAFGAFMILQHYLHDEELDERLNRIGREEDDLRAGLTELSPVRENFIGRFLSRNSELEQTRVQEERRSAIIVVTILAISGELLHGFGDLLLHSLH